MKRKIILASAVFAFAVFSLAWSYSSYGKKATENASATPYGEAFVCRKFAEISRIIAIDAQKESRKREVREWAYNADTGELVADADLSGFALPYFYIEGRPTEPQEFILHGIDAECEPNERATVFLNGKIAAENRDYVFGGDGKTLALQVPSKEIASLSVVWNTQEGLSSFNELTQDELDLYAELEAVWLSERSKKSIMAQTETPVLEFAEGSAAPRVAMRPLSESERREMAAAFPVITCKLRRNKSAASLSNEAGFKVDLPKTRGEYKALSVMLVETSLKGEKSKSVHFVYDKTDALSENSISVEACKAAGAETQLSDIISSETLGFKFPVQKQTYWALAAYKEGGAMEYCAEKMCLYTWTKNGTLYKTECAQSRAAQTEAFLKEL